MKRLFQEIQKQISKCYINDSKWNYCEKRNLYINIFNGKFTEIDFAKIEKLQGVDGVKCLILLPTLWGRGDKSETLEAILRAIDQSRGGSCLLIVSVQSEYKYRKDIIDSIRDKLLELKVEDKFILLLTEIKSKAYSINQAIILAKKMNLLTIGWMDDDVLISKNAFLELFEDLRNRGFIGSSGALKCPIPKKHLTSKFLNFAKDKMMTKKTKYPHGCCMMVGVSSIKKLIPTRYVCDDGFFFFELLDMQLKNPQSNIKIVESCTCKHYVGGNLKDTYYRIRRSIISTIVYCADYPLDKSWYYLKEIQFKGLFPDIFSDTSIKDRLIKCIFKFIFLIWHVIILIELFMRRVAGCPLKQISWSAYTWENTEPLKKQSL
ncbi:hypothetical protein [Brenneria tiliae]|uniref:Glycosyltransferase n=1 Tax=Brenneria tiliae TaxID=2914984 RepID=A0ABT0MNK8_9GAMM|nr:hypothetical protein [Brenneria tiliae]MCL2891416.1 hypothetical protein [Brenneria tiliae]